MGSRPRFAICRASRRYASSDASGGVQSTRASARSRPVARRCCQPATRSTAGTKGKGSLNEGRNRRFSQEWSGGPCSETGVGERCGALRSFHRKCSDVFFTWPPLGVPKHFDKEMFLFKGKARHVAER